MDINVQNVERFKFISYKIIPLVYDDSLSYYEFLCKVMQKLNEVISSLDNQNEILEAFNGEILGWETRTDDKYSGFVNNINTLFEAFKQGEVAARNTFEEQITAQQDAFETEISGQQTTFEQNITEQQNEFESSMQTQWDEFFELYLQTLNIVQGTGDSETSVMSQKAVTDSLNSIQALYPIFPSPTGIPNIDTTNGTLTIKNRSTIYYGVGEYYLIPSDVVINLNDYQYDAKKIVFNSEDLTFYVRSFSAINQNEYPVMFIQYGNGIVEGVSFCGDYAVDGVLRLPNKMFNSVLCPIFPSSNGIPEIDTINETLTLRALTTIYYGAGKYHLLNEAVVIDLTEYPNDAKKVVFNFDELAFHVRRYNVINENEGIIALIQYNTTTKKFVGACINCDYKVNGYYYGDDQIVTSAINSNAITFKSNGIKSVSHRGYLTEAPENTIPAFRLSKQNGFTLIEFDVRFTSDGIPVIIHDASINRTARNADGTEISTTINVSESTYNELLNYDFGVWKSAKYTGTKIPTFEQTIALCRNIGLGARIELKGNAGTLDNVRILYNIVKKYGMLKNVEWASSSYTSITNVHTVDDTANVCYIVSAITQTVVDEILALKTDNNITIAANINNLDETSIALAMDNNIPVDAYTIANDNQIINCNPYVSSFTTNKPNAAMVLYKDNIV